MKNATKSLISVLIPAYNHQAYIKEAVLSVVNQTYGYENLQLIIADDCSSDNTAPILRELSLKYKFMLIIHEKNKGLCSTLNEMISLSKGEYITSFASDDIMTPDRIEKQVEILGRNPDIDILTGDAILIDQKGKIISNYSQNTVEKLVTYSFDNIFLLEWSGISAGTAIIKRDLYLRIGAYDKEVKVEDYFFWLKAAYNNAKIVKCSYPFLYYRVHGEAASRNDELVVNEVSKILKSYEQHPKYPLALRNHKIYNMSKAVFYSKRSVINQLVKNPALMLDKKTIKLIIMLLLPSFILKSRFPENYYRYAAR